MTDVKASRPTHTDPLDFKFTVDDPAIRVGPRDMQWNPQMDVVHFSLDACMFAIRAYEESVYEAWQAKKKGIPVVWTDVWGPYQLVIQAFGFPFIGYGTCASWLGHYHLSGRLVEISERAGISRDICNYMTAPYSYLLEDHRIDRRQLPWRMGYPPPDLVIEVNSLCDDQVVVYRNLTHRRIQERAPWRTYVVDVPFNVIGGEEEEVAGEIVQYEVEQLNEVIERIEHDTGYLFDEERLASLIKNANEMSRVGREITELRKAVPAPMSYLDAMACVLDPMLNLLGTERGVEAIRCALDEVKNRVQIHLGVVEDEKVRLLWNGIASSSNLGVFSYWYDQGVVFAFETNSAALRFHKGYQMDGSSRERALETMCRKFLTNTTNSDKKRVLEDQKNLVKDYHIDGVVHASNFGCRPYSIGMIDEMIALRQASTGTHLPQIIFDQDLTNEQYFDDAKFKNQVQALIDTIIAHKGPI